MNHGLIPIRGKTTIYLAQEFIQAPVCWVWVGSDSSRVMKLTTRLHVVPRLWMCGAILIPIIRLH